MTVGIPVTIGWLLATGLLRELPATSVTRTAYLSIVAFLAGAEEAEFGAVRDTAGLTDSHLSKQAAALEAVGAIPSGTSAPPGTR